MAEGVFDVRECSKTTHIQLVEPGGMVNVVRWRRRSSLRVESMDRRVQRRYPRSPAYAWKPDQPSLSSTAFQTAQNWVLDDGLDEVVRAKPKLSGTDRGIVDGHNANRGRETLHAGWRCLWVGGVTAGDVFVGKQPH